MLSLQSCGRVSEPWFALNKAIYDDILEVALSDIQTTDSSDVATQSCSELLKLLTDGDTQGQRPSVESCGQTRGSTKPAIHQPTDRNTNKLFTIGASPSISSSSLSSKSLIRKSSDKSCKIYPSSRTKGRSKQTNSLNNVEGKPETSRQTDPALEKSVEGNNSFTMKETDSGCVVKGDQHEQADTCERHSSMSHKSTEEVENHDVTLDTSSSSSSCKSPSDCRPLDLTLPSAVSKSALKRSSCDERVQKENLACSPTKLDSIDRVGWTKVEKDTLLKVVERLSISFLTEECSKESYHTPRLNIPDVLSLKTLNVSERNTRNMAPRKDDMRSCDRIKSNLFNKSNLPTDRNLSECKNFSRIFLRSKISKPNVSGSLPAATRSLARKQRNNKHSSFKFSRDSRQDRKSVKFLNSSLISGRHIVDEMSKEYQQFWAPVDKTVVSNIIELIFNIRDPHMESSSDEIKCEAPGSMHEEEEVKCDVIIEEQEQVSGDEMSDPSRSYEGVNECIATFKWKSDILRRVRYDQISAPAPDDTSEQWRLTRSISSPLTAA